MPSPEPAVVLHPVAAQIGRAFTPDRGTLSLSATAFAAAEASVRAVPVSERPTVVEHLVALAITLHAEDARAAAPAVAQLCDLAALLLTSKNEALRMFADAQARVADAGQAFGTFSGRSADARPSAEPQKAPAPQVKAVRGLRGK